MTNDNEPTEINQSAILLRKLYDDSNSYLVPFKCQLFTEIKRFINLFFDSTLKIHSDVVNSTSFDAMATVILNYYNETLINESKLTRISFDRALLLLISKIAQENKNTYYNWLFPKAPETKKYVLHLKSIDYKTEELFRNEHIRMKDNLKLANPIQKIETEFLRLPHNWVADLKLSVITEITSDNYTTENEISKIRNYVHSALIYHGILRPIEELLVFVV